MSDISEENSEKKGDTPVVQSDRIIMRSSSSIAFEIDNAGLRCSSPVPRHVAMRFSESPEASPSAKRLRNSSSKSLMSSALAVGVPISPKSDAGGKQRASRSSSSERQLFLTLSPMQLDSAKIHVHHHACHLSPQKKARGGSPQQKQRILQEAQGEKQGFSSRCQNSTGCKQSHGGQVLAAGRYREDILEPTSATESSRCKYLADTDVAMIEHGKAESESANRTMVSASDMDNGSLSFLSCRCCPKKTRQRFDCSFDDEGNTGVYSDSALKKYDDSKKGVCDFCAEECGSSGGESDSEDGDINYIRNLERSVANRMRILEERKARISERHQRVRDLARERRERQQAEAEALRESLENAMYDADKKREHFVSTRRSASAQRNARVKEVAHARQVRDFNERRAKRHALKAKLRSSQWRRQQLAKVSRSRLVSTASLNEAIRQHAAMEIQSLWRVKKLYPHARRYARLKIEPAVLTALSFAAAATKLQESATIASAQHLLQRLQLLAVDPPDFARGPRVAPSVARVFLTHVIILSHPSDIIEGIEDGSPLEKELLETARALDTALAALLEGDIILRRAQVYSQVTALLQAWFAFHVTFDAFKKKDTQSVVDNLVAHGLELARLLANVSVHHSETDAEYRPSIEKQLRVTRRRLTSVGGGAALERFEEALEAEGLAQFLGDAAMRLTPSPAAQDSVLLATPSKRPIQRVRGRQRSSSLGEADQQAQAEDTSRNNYESSRSRQPQAAETVQTGDISQPQPRPRQTASVTDAPSSSFVSSIFQNRVMAHELAMDPSFRIKEPEDTHGVLAISMRAMRDRVNELAEIGNFSFLPAIVSEISKDLQDLVSEGSLKEQIRDQLDEALIVQMIENNALDAGELLSKIVSLMLRLCAPVRDSEVQALLQQSSLGDAVIAIRRVLEKIKIDQCNHLLTQLRPVIQSRIISYECKDFERYLASQGDLDSALSRTRAWLETAASDLQRTMSERNPENISQLPQNSQPRFEEVYNEALVSLLVFPGGSSSSSSSSNGISQASAPETLQLDARRIFELQNRVQAVVVATTVVLLARNMFPWLQSGAEAGQLAQRLLLVLNSNKVAPTREQIAELVVSAGNRGNISPERQAAGAQQQRELVQAMVQRVVSGREAVYGIVQRRVATAMRQWLATGRQPTREVLASQGLDMVQRELDAIGHDVAVLARHNKTVYAQWYDAILCRRLSVEPLVATAPNTQVE